MNPYAKYTCLFGLIDMRGKWRAGGGEVNPQWPPFAKTGAHSMAKPTSIINKKNQIYITLLTLIIETLDA